MHTTTSLAIAATTVIDVKAEPFNAVGNGQHDDGAPIRNALAAAAATDGPAVVWFPAGTYLVSQTAALTNTGAVGLVSTDNVWIDAHVKETDLTHVKPGDPVGIFVDTYPSRLWSGTVESISPASGAEFSILPAQNASGNWVKVVQRISVRIHVDRKPDDPILRAGMSVTVDIDTGHRRSLFELF